MAESEGGDLPLEAGTEEQQIEKLLDSFAERLLRGEGPSVTEYAKKFPELSRKIRELFPALQLLGYGEDAGRKGEPDQPAEEGWGIPERLGNFRLVREIGRGGMGVVYEAIDETLDRRVALKVLPFHSLTGRAPVERFQREARAAANLQHRSIVPILGVGEHRGVHFYAMQFIEGESLDKILDEVKGLREPGRATPEGPRVSSRSRALALALLSDRFDFLVGSDSSRAETLASSVSPRPGSSSPERSTGSILKAETTTPQVNEPGAREKAGVPCPEVYFHSLARLLRDAADAVAYANDRGVLHRDLKPSNFIVDTRGHLWITDFGLAITIGEDRLTLSGEIVGTLRYMAPERFRGVCDPRSDVYSLGLTLYEALTGGPAFPDAEAPRLHQILVEGVTRRPRDADPQIPADLEGIVLKAVDRDPERRHSSALELSQDLTRFLEDRPPPRRLPVRRARAKGSSMRRRTILLAALLALLGLSAAVYLWWASLHRPHEIQHFAVRDFDGDGRADLVTANGDSGSISLLRNDGAGSFSVAGHYEVGERPFCVLPMSFEGSGNVGLVVCNFGSKSLSLLHWDGKDGFRNLGDLVLKASPEFAAAFEEAGIQRVAVATNDKALHFLNIEGNGLFKAGGFMELTAPGVVIESADFDGDGRIDLVLSHGMNPHHYVDLLKGLGDGGFAAPVSLGPLTTSWGLKARDLNEDGQVDLVVAPWGENKIWVFLNKGGDLGMPLEVPLPGEVQSIAVGDFNRDGSQDIAAAGDRDPPYVCILWGRGNGAFVLRTDLPRVGKGASWIEAADIDGDQDLDLVVANFRSDDLVVFFNDLGGGFDRYRRLSLVSWWARLKKPAAP